MRSSSLVPFALIVASLVSAAPARADDSETFFAQGRMLRAGKKCAEAIVAFRRALDLKPQGLGSLRNVAECEVELGQFASARASYWNLRRAVLQSNDPKYEGWDRDAEEAYKKLEPKVARLTVKLTGVSPERATVSIDGKPLDPRLLGVELERDLGPHTIEAAYGGVTPLSEKRTLGPGAHEVVTLEIPAPKAGERGAPPPPPVTPADTGSRSVRNAGIAMVTLGALGAVGLGVSVAMRQSALAAFSGCAPSYTGCDPSLQGELTKGQTSSTLVFVFTGVAIAGLGAGIPLLVIGSRGPTAEPTASPSASVRAVLGVVPAPGGAALHAGVRF